MQVPIHAFLSTESQGQHLARLRMQALRQGGLRASGQGHIQGIVPGCTFSVREHPKAQANVEYITLHTRFCIENVGEDTQRSHANLNAHALLQRTAQDFGLKAFTDTQRLSGQWQVHTAFELQATTEALRPELTQPKPQAYGPESALVCGPGADTYRVSAWAVTGNTAWATGASSVTSRTRRFWCVCCA